jgi:glycosyltransferase involved in cell wall biosynthesis
MVYGGLRRLMAERWDVVHCWEEPYVAAGAQIARAAPPRARFVFATFQNLAKTYPPPFSWIERSVVDRANGWIAFGHTVHDTLRARTGYTTVPSRIIPPGVDTRAFAPDSGARTRIRAGWGWDDGVPVVGFVGRFVKQKGCALLVEALSRLTVPWRAVFVGGGPEQAALESFAEAHPGRVRIATDVSHDRVPEYLNAMDVLCAPSQTTPRWREQFGRMLIEAMSCGVPVIASRSGEIPYVVQDAGVILPEDDAASWTDALQSVLTSDVRRRTLAARGVARARTEFDWPVVARRHLEFFEEIAS